MSEVPKIKIEFMAKKWFFVPVCRVGLVGEWDMTKLQKNFGEKEGDS